jgi:hypothetical protein
MIKQNVNKLPGARTAQIIMKNRVVKEVETMVSWYCSPAMNFADPVLLFDKYVG